MTKTRLSVFLLFFLCCFSLACLPLLYASTESQIRVAEGRNLLFNNGNMAIAGVVEATAKFREALAADPNDREAALFLSVARIASLLDNTAVYSPGSPIENVVELLDGIGMGQEGRDIFNWQADFSKDIHGDVILPQNVPNLGDVQAFIQSIVLPELDSAISNLTIVLKGYGENESDSFSTLITAEELGDQYGNDYEIDYGDVLLYKSGLYALKTVLEILLAYDMDVVGIRDVISKIQDETFKLNIDLLDPNSRFITLLSNGADRISSAKTSFRNFIDTYFTASSYIRYETDDQGNDLFTIETEDANDELKFRENLESINSSFANSQPAVMGDDNPIRIDFSHFFDYPLDLRYYLPVFNDDPQVDELLKDGICLLPDTTFSGVIPDGLPDCTQLSGAMVTPELWIRAVINTIDKGPIEGVWKQGGQDTTARGDKVIWGYFYASPNDVSWGNANNPDLFVKIWIDVSGSVYVDYFHVSVPDIDVYTDFANDGTADKQSIATLSQRFVEHSRVNGLIGVKAQMEDGISPLGYSAEMNPTGSVLSNDLRIGAVINTVDQGPIEGRWRLGGQDTTASGDKVVWGYFYADPDIMSWGSQNNPDLFVKVWFDARGPVYVDFFHVSVPDIEVYSDLPSSGGYDKIGTTVLSNRFVEHRY